MATLAVDIQDVSKRFRLYHRKYTSLKERVIHAGRTPFTDLWALRDIAFEVNEGDTVGILGRNGSGKSTLLKCVCGVLQPTEGQVVVKGSLAGLLELGAGFQPDLTGRQNIYLNGSLLGLSKSDIDKVFDEVVAFAELDQFIDQQVKFYSSGMYVRLGFAVAVNVDPDVLVIDEVLAVGDERFQRKCLDRVKSVPGRGAHDHLRVALARPGPLDLQQGGRARATARWSPTVPRARRSGSSGRTCSRRATCCPRPTPRRPRRRRPRRLGPSSSTSRTRSGSPG